MQHFPDILKAFFFDLLLNKTIDLACRVMAFFIFKIGNHKVE